MARPFRELYEKLNPEARAEIEAMVQRSLERRTGSFPQDGVTSFGSGLYHRAEP